jgi:hypothetical protein
LEIEFGAPLHFTGTGNEDDAVVAGYVDQVKSTLSEMLDRGARRRRGEPVAESA